MGLKAIIFDMDGVLIDSIPIFFSEYRAILEKYSFDLTEEIFLREWNGQKASEVIPRILADRSQEEQRKVLQDCHQVREIVKNKAKAFTQIPLILSSLSNYKLAVASSSPKDVVNTVLENSDIKKYFEVIIDSDDVHKTKPDPEIFLAAANKLEIQPEDCLVIEDALQGMQAAKNANMKCIGLLTTLKEKQVPKEVIIANNHQNILNIINSLK